MTQHSSPESGVPYEDPEFVKPASPESDTELRLLVDIVWNHATESTAVPSTKTADALIAKYRQCFPALAQRETHCDICGKAFEPNDDVLLMGSKGNFHQSCYRARHAQCARADIAKAIAYDLENGSAHGARVVTTPHLDNYHVTGHVNLLALADAVLALSSTVDHPVENKDGGAS